MDLPNFPNDLTINSDSGKRNKHNNTRGSASLNNTKANESKMTMNFLAVSREKNKKRAYLDWNDKPMLLINQNEVEPQKRGIESHAMLPTQPLIDSK